MSLFDSFEDENRRKAQPLAARMRPRTLDEFVGQEDFLAPGKLLRRLLKADRLGSVIFYGPPGTGKTTLAKLLASESHADFCQISAVTSGVKELREVLARAADTVAAEGRRTLLFVDEIHRFNKAQQDVLLPDVEEGVVTLVGATTENPFFTVNNALLSRSRIFQFHALTIENIKTVLRRALTDSERGFGKTRIQMDEEALEYLARTSDGDARRALSSLEIGVLSTFANPIHFTLEMAAESVQKRVTSHDRDGDSHYDTVSALIKSIRGSDPDAAIYWLAKMLEGGEEVRFLARRLMILASEDVGNADPHALPMAVACAQACEMIGLPECQLNLAQTVIYLAAAPKSNAATNAIFAARKDVAEGEKVPVPTHLCDAHYDGSAQLGHTGYQYAHDFPDAIAPQEYLGVEKRYYEPTERGFESEIAARLEYIRARMKNQPKSDAKTDSDSKSDSKSDSDSGSKSDSE